MGADWTHAEVAATVADYLDMLDRELRREPYNKREHNRWLEARLDHRSAAAIELKHQNISAILIELGLPYIDGYKPRANYQKLLRTEVEAQLAANLQIERVTETVVDAPAELVHAVGDIGRVFVDPPDRGRPRQIFERTVPATPRQVNYLERESRNRSLGRAGELFVLEAEHRRLWDAGCKHLAERIEHVSETRGDGLGYDVVSFEADGRERCIEVKTTAFGPMTPFFASANEVTVSDTLPGFQLYRVFRFREDPRIFCLAGSLRQSCSLEATQFRASLA